MIAVWMLIAFAPRDIFQVISKIKIMEILVYTDIIVYLLLVHFCPILTLKTFSAVDFLHKNFSFFLQKPSFESSTYHRSSSSTFFNPSSTSLNSMMESENESPTEELTLLLLKLLKVNGTPLIDISLDLSPRNSSMYIGVIRVPQRAALLPRLVRPGKDLSFINRWVS